MTTDDRTLLQFLIDLNSNRDDWSIYVDADNPMSDWRMGFNEFDYGNRVPIGSLATLSFHQDQSELLSAALHQQYGRTIGWTVYKGKEVLLNVEKTISLFNDPTSKLDSKFRKQIEESISLLEKDWKLKEINAFLEHSLPNIIAKHNATRTAISIK